MTIRMFAICNLGGDESFTLHIKVKTSVDGIDLLSESLNKESGIK